jgi:hypothetical protein
VVPIRQFQIQLQRGGKHQHVPGVKARIATIACNCMTSKTVLMGTLPGKGFVHPTWWCVLNETYSFDFLTVAL